MQYLSNNADEYAETITDFTIYGWVRKDVIVAKMQSKRRYLRSQETYWVHSELAFSVDQNRHSPVDGPKPKISRTDITTLQTSKEYVEPEISYYYFYYDETADPPAPVDVVNQVYAALSKGDMEAVLKHASEKNCIIRIYGSPVPSLNGIYRDPDEFSAYLSNLKNAYIEKNAEYKVIGLTDNSNVGFSKVDATITAERITNSGVKFSVEVKQRFWIDRRGKIQRLVSETKAKVLAVSEITGDARVDSSPQCLYTCTNDDTSFPDLLWGKNKSAELAAIKYDYALQQYIACVCERCGGYPEVKFWTARQDACALAPKPPG